MTCADHTRRKVILALVLLCFAAFAVRVWFGLGLTGHVAGDAPAYDALARSLAEGRGYVAPHSGQPTAYRAPGYPFFLAAIYTIFPGAGFRFLRILQAALSACTIPLVYALARHCGERRVALLAAALFAFYPSSIYFSALLITETLALFAFTLFLLLLARAIREEQDKGGIWWHAACGAVLGLATLIRPITLLLPFYLLALFLIFPLQAPLRTRGIVYLLLSFCLVLLPWSVRNYLCFDRFVPVSTTAGTVIWQGLQPDPRGYGFTPWEQIEQVLPEGLDEVEASRYLVRDALRFARRHPGRTLWLCGLKLASLVSPFDGRRCRLGSAYNPVYGIVLMTALWAGWQNLRTSPIARAAGWVILYFVLMALVFYGSPRFRLSFEPLLIVFSAVGITGLYRQRGQGSARRLLGLILSVNLLFYLVANPLIRWVKPYLG